MAAVHKYAFGVNGDPPNVTAASSAKSYAATITKSADDRARLRTALVCVVGERVLVTFDYSDGAVTYGVSVYAVHAEKGLVDVSGVRAEDLMGCKRVSVRRCSR